MSSLQTDHVAINEPNSTTTLRAELDVVKAKIKELEETIAIILEKLA